MGCCGVLWGIVGCSFGCLKAFVVLGVFEGFIGFWLCFERLGSLEF